MNEDVHLKLLVPYLAAGAIIGRGGEAVEAIKRQTGARLKMSKVNDFYPGTTERVCLITGTIGACLQLYDYITEKVAERPELSCYGSTSSPPPLPPNPPLAISATSSQPIVSTSATPAAHGLLANMIIAGSQHQYMLPNDYQHAYTTAGSSPYCCHQQHQLPYSYGVFCADRRHQVKLLVPNNTAGIIIGKSGCFIKKIMEKSGTLVQVSQRPTEITLPERCIVVTGDLPGRRTAMSMILSKIAEDPESASCPYFSYSLINEPVASAFPTGSPYATGMAASPILVDIPGDHGIPAQAVVLCPATSTSTSSVSTGLDELTISGTTPVSPYQHVLPTPVACRCPVSAPTFLSVVAGSGGVNSNQLLALPSAPRPSDLQLTAVGTRLPTVSTWPASPDISVSEFVATTATSIGSQPPSVGPQFPLPLIQQPLSSPTAQPHVTPPLLPGFGDVLVPRYATGQTAASINDRILNAFHFFQNYARVMPLLESSGLVRAPNTNSPGIAHVGEPNCLLVSPGDSLVCGYPPQLFTNTACPTAFPILSSTTAFQPQLVQQQQVYEELIPVISPQLVGLPTTTGANSTGADGQLTNQQHQLHHFYSPDVLTNFEPSFHPILLTMPNGDLIVPRAHPETATPTRPPAVSAISSTAIHHPTSTITNGITAVDDAAFLMSGGGVSVSVNNVGPSADDLPISQLSSQNFIQQTPAGAQLFYPTSNCLLTTNADSTSLLSTSTAAVVADAIALHPTKEDRYGNVASRAMAGSTVSRCTTPASGSQLQSPTSTSSSTYQPPGFDGGGGGGLLLVGTAQQVHSALAELKQQHGRGSLPVVSTSKARSSCSDDNKGMAPGVEVTLSPGVPWRVDRIQPLELDTSLPLGIVEPLASCCRCYCCSIASSTVTAGCGSLATTTVSAISDGDT